MDLDLEIIYGFCDEANDLITRWEALCVELSKESTEARLSELFRIAHNIKGGSRAVGLSDLGEFIHKIEDGITLIREGEVSFTVRINSLLLEVQKFLSEWILAIRNNPRHVPDWQPLASRFQLAFSNSKKNTCAPASSQDSAHSVDLVPNQLPIGSPNIKLELPAVGINSAKEEKAQKKEPVKQDRSLETIRISASKLDQILQVIGELSIHQSIVWHGRSSFAGAGKMIAHSIQLGQKLTKELYDRALSLRMQPIQGLFQRLERNMIDLSKTLDKDVDVEVSGGDVELDKSVMERIVDPLTHIVRNAIDHGIESQATRQEQGKPAKGKIVVGAIQEAGNIEIRVSDDGKGLSVEKLLAKARDQELIPVDAKLSKDEIYQLIFMAGFSTADKVTDVSGRGVGMDVVKRALEDLHGTIRIVTEEGRGTVFTISLPTSVSILDGVIFGLCGQKYVVPINELDEVIDLSGQKGWQGQAMFPLRGQVVPIIGLDKFLRHSSEHVAKYNSLLICKRGNQRLALLVDELLGEQQIVVRPLNENMKDTFGLMGGTILSNGEPGIIVDLPTIADFYLNKYASERKAS